MRTFVGTAGAAILLGGIVAAEDARLDRLPVATFAHPAIAYETAATSDPIDDLNARIAGGQAHLQFDGPTGYLRSVLDALRVPLDSQMLVMSKTGIQALYTSPANPRALYFNDTVTVGYIAGAPLLELAVQDPRQGVVFYTIDQKPQAQLQRRSNCLTCHNVASALYVPGMLFRSAFTTPEGPALGGVNDIDDRMAFADRWGGWYVTGTHGSMRHAGNIAAFGRGTAGADEHTLNQTSVADAFDRASYLASDSDLVALLVFGHQVRMMNLITRVGWDARVAAAEHRLDFTKGPIRSAVDEFVDTMLFVDEAPFTSPVRGTSGFAERFTAEGPRDRAGRSLRQLDLTTRLFRYRCSYMIYSPAFRALPDDLRLAIFARARTILAGGDPEPKYAHITAADRESLLGILAETVPEMRDVQPKPDPSRIQ